MSQTFATSEHKHVLYQLTEIIVEGLRRSGVEMNGVIGEEIELDK